MFKKRGVLNLSSCTALYCELLQLENKPVGGDKKFFSPFGLDIGRKGDGCMYGWVYVCMN